MPIGKTAFVWTTTLLLAIGFLTLAGIVGTTWYLVERAEEYAAEVLTSRDVRAAAVAVRTSLQDMETGQRGFILTGEDEYLEPYTRGSASLVTAMPRLADMVESYLPEGRDEFAKLQGDVSTKTGELEKTIALVRQGRSSEVVELVRSSVGKEAMDRARLWLDELIAAADERLATNVAAQRGNTVALRWVVILGGMIILLVGGGSMLVALNYTRALADARGKLETMNAALEERVLERTRELVSANEEIQRFAYIVTHDLRAPLVNIMGFTSELDDTMRRVQAYMLSDGKPLSDQQILDARQAAEEDLPEAIGFIRSSTRKMDGLINAILKISRDGRRPLKPEPLELSGMIRATADSLHHQVTETGGRIEVSARPVDVIGDRLLIEQVFGNLLDNAVKYRQPGRAIEIDVSIARLPGARVKVAVRDNGRGISKADHQRVFDLFRRSGTQDMPGEGIGLAHVRSLLRNIGGDISLESEPGVGTTFTVTFPSDIRTIARSNGDEQ